MTDILDNLIKNIKCSAEEVFNVMGSGHSEAVYHKAFEVELRNRNIVYSTKAPITLEYKGVIVGYSEPDIIVYPLGTDSCLKIIIELKATTYEPRSSEKAQIKSYMRSTGGSLGILINFPQPTSKSPREKIDFILFGDFEKYGFKLPPQLPQPHQLKCISVNQCDPNYSRNSIPKMTF